MDSLNNDSLNNNDKIALNRDSLVSDVSSVPVTSKLQKLYGQFRSMYPVAGLVTELVRLEGGIYIVRAGVEVGDITLVTAMATASEITIAEDLACIRVLEILGISSGSSLPASSQVFATEHPLPHTKRVNRHFNPDLNTAIKRDVHPTIAQKDDFSPESSFNPGIHSQVEQKAQAEIRIDVQPANPESDKAAIASAAVNGNSGENNSFVSNRYNAKDNVDHNAKNNADNEGVSNHAIQNLSIPVAEPEAIIAAKALNTAQKDGNGVITSVQDGPHVRSISTPIQNIDVSLPVAAEQSPIPHVDENPYIVEDWSDELAQVEIELKRLGWSAAQEASYLQQTYGKPSRDYITDYAELVDFLKALRLMQPSIAPPTPTSSSNRIEPWKPESHIHDPKLDIRNSETANLNLPRIDPQQSANPGTTQETNQKPLTLSRPDMMDQVMAECKRLGWTKQQGSEYLLHTYNKLTRRDLTDEELYEFVTYLKSLQSR